MKRVLSVVAYAVAVMALCSPLPAASAEPTDDELQQAHKELQEAIAKIRAYHAQYGEDSLRHVSEADVEKLLVETKKPRMGVVIESTREHEGDEAGAIIIAVSPGGPAEEAGLETGDIITHVDGMALADGPGRPHEVLVRQLRELGEGDAITVDYLREGAPGSATVTLEVMEEMHFGAADFHWRMPEGELLMEHLPSHGNWFFPHGWLDMELVSLNPELGEYFGIDEGVLVVRAPDSEELGLEGGDVIISVGDRLVKSPTHAMRILRSYEPEEVMAVEIIRRGRREVIKTTVPEHRVELFEHHR